MEKIVYNKETKSFAIKELEESQIKAFNYIDIIESKDRAYADDLLTRIGKSSPKLALFLTYFRMHYKPTGILPNRLYIVNYSNNLHKADSLFNFIENDELSESILNSMKRTQGVLIRLTKSTKFILKAFNIENDKSKYIYLDFNNLKDKSPVGPEPELDSIRIKCSIHTDTLSSPSKIRELKTIL